MYFFNRILPNALFALNVLLLFLLLVEGSVVIPVWLQPVGRLHPLMLHFPIGLLVLLGLMELFKGDLLGDAYQRILHFILGLAALTTVLAALMGLFLSREGGYGGNDLFWHKWTGAGLSFLVYGWFAWKDFLQTQRWVYRGVLGLVLAGVLLAGHLGATLTHGADFVWAPLIQEETAVFTEENTAFEVAVAPILERKCKGCHNAGKQKGQLDMSSRASLVKGGENGPIWEAGNPDHSPMIQRALLPLDAEEHMPPEGKPQLSPEELNLLHEWIRSGADLEKAVKNYSDSDPFIAMVLPLLSPERKTEDPVYNFEFASLKTLEKLNTSYRTVVPVSPNSPALHAQFFVRQAFKSEDLEELKAVKDQVVYLNLSNMPITDEDLNTLAQFPNLEKLLLNGTDISGARLEVLTQCTQLRSLGIANTQVGAELEGVLEKWEHLASVFVWNTPLTEAEIEALGKRFPHIEIQRGFVPDEHELLKLSAPQMVTKERVLDKGDEIVLKHNFPGVELRYTLDGSEPDSLSSPLYEEPITLPGYSHLRVKAFKPGWLSSRESEYTFFVRGLNPQEATLVHQPNPQYPGSGAKTLLDGEKGDPNNFRRKGQWLGFKDSPFDAIIDFGEEKAQVSKVTISYLRNIGSYIMPPTTVKIYGGDTPGQFELLKSLRPEQPTKPMPNLVGGLDVALPESQYRYYRVEMEPVRVLPEWHRGAGDQGWVFVDELVFY